MWCKWTRGVAGRQAGRQARRAAMLAYFTLLLSMQTIFYYNNIAPGITCVHATPRPPSPKPLFAPPSRACDECIRILICQVLRHN